MEFSQPRPCGAQGAKPTHDFLSLYSPAQQDPAPNVAGGYLQTHDFLQPLDQHVGTNIGAKEAINNFDCIEKSFLSSAPHILPGGMGAYSISHISCMNQSQKVPKPEGIMISAAQSSSSNNNDENSNCSSYTGSGFTLWEDQSSLNKGKTGKENIAGTRYPITDGVMKIGVPWMTSMEQPSQSSSILNHPNTTFSSLSSSRPSSAPKNQRFVNMKSAKSVQDDEDDDEEFVIKKEPSFHHKGTILGKVDIANLDQKPNSPRSKHSATEQRRRSKINDRFSALRGIIPHGDQKRDKASFLLEVIEYIQFLKEKVHKYEDSYTNEPPKLICSQDTTTTASQAQPQLSKDQEMIIESGTISISTLYSQGLSSALTQALKSSGVDLSQANISVQIDLGKRSNATTLHSSQPHLKEKEIPELVGCSRLGSSWEEEGDEGLKRLKRSRK